MTSPPTLQRRARRRLLPLQLQRAAQRRVEWAGVQMVEEGDVGGDVEEGVGEGEGSKSQRSEDGGKVLW